MRKLLLLALAMGCSSRASDPPPAPVAGCAANEIAAESRCLPRFDACGPLEVPKAFGGCVRAGVPDDGCSTGFASDGRGGCTPKLPASACRAGELAVPGETTCHPVATCGEGTWGDIPIDTTTIFVDASYAGGDGDGSKTKPFATLQKAIDNGSGKLVAVAAGTYDEDLLIKQPMKIWGRCPSMVTVRGVASTFAIEINAQVELHRIGIRGPQIGVIIDDAEGVKLEQVWVHDTGSRGIAIERVKRVTAASIVDSLVENAKGWGISDSSSVVTVERTVVRDVSAAGPEPGGGMISLYSKAAASLVARTSLIERAQTYGVSVRGSKATFEGVVIRDTKAGTDGMDGMGISSRLFSPASSESDITVTGSLIENNHDAGIEVIAAKALVERTVIRKSRARVADKVFGTGILTQDATSFVMKDSLLEENEYMGALVEGASKATFERVIARKTLPQASNKNGGIGFVGIPLADKAVPAELTLLDVLVEDSHDFGIASVGANLVVNGALVRNTQPQLSNGLYGDGLIVIPRLEGANVEASLAVEGITVEKSARAGVLVVGSPFSMKNSRLLCNAFDLDLVSKADDGRAYTVAATLADEGGNGCGCGSLRVCKVQTVTTDPITPPRP